jgi:hypothetical protein
MSDEKSREAYQLSEVELKVVAGGNDTFEGVTYISCDKNYCGYIDCNGQTWYLPCPKCGHAMHFETHEFLTIHLIGNTYCDKCDAVTAGFSFKRWEGTQWGLVNNANERL